MHDGRKKIAVAALSLLLGIVIGGYLFRDIRPRSFLAVPHCEHSCLAPSDLAGLMAAVGVTKLGGLPFHVVKETEKTIVVKHPAPHARVHYLVMPKKDIKDLGDTGEEDLEYLTDAFAVIGDIIRTENLSAYQVKSNGPDVQLMRYLHFHLLAE